MYRSRMLRATSCLVLLEVSFVLLVFTQLPAWATGASIYDKSAIPNVQSPKSSRADDFEITADRPRLTRREISQRKARKAYEKKKQEIWRKYVTDPESEIHRKITFLRGLDLIPSDTLLKELKQKKSMPLVIDLVNDGDCEAAAIRPLSKLKSKRGRPCKSDSLEEFPNTSKKPLEKVKVHKEPNYGTESFDDLKDVKEKANNTMVEDQLPVSVINRKVCSIGTLKTSFHSVESNATNFINGNICTITSNGKAVAAIATSVGGQFYTFSSVTRGIQLSTSTQTHNSLSIAVSQIASSSGHIIYTVQCPVASTFSGAAAAGNSSKEYSPLNVFPSYPSFSQITSQSSLIPSDYSRPQTATIQKGQCQRKQFEVCSIEFAPTECANIFSSQDQGSINKCTLGNKQKRKMSTEDNASQKSSEDPFVSPAKKSLRQNPEVSHPSNSACTLALVGGKRNTIVPTFVRVQTSLATTVTSTPEKSIPSPCVVTFPSSLQEIGELVKSIGSSRGPSTRTTMVSPKGKAFLPFDGKKSGLQDLPLLLPLPSTAEETPLVQTASFNATRDAQEVNPNIALEDDPKQKLVAGKSVKNKSNKNTENSGGIKRETESGRLQEQVKKSKRLRSISEKRSSCDDTQPPSSMLQTTSGSVPRASSGNMSVVDKTKRSKRTEPKSQLSSTCSKCQCRSEPETGNRRNRERKATKKQLNKSVQTEGSLTDLLIEILKQRGRTTC